MAPVDEIVADPALVFKRMSVLLSMAVCDVVVESVLAARSVVAPLLLFTLKNRVVTPRVPAGADSVVCAPDSSVAAVSPESVAAAPALSASCWPAFMVAVVPPLMLAVLDAPVVCTLTPPALRSSATGSNKMSRVAVASTDVVAATFAVKSLLILTVAPESCSGVIAEADPTYKLSLPVNLDAPVALCEIVAAVSVVDAPPAKNVSLEPPLVMVKLVVGMMLTVGAVSCNAFDDCRVTVPAEVADVEPICSEPLVAESDV